MTSDKMSPTTNSRYTTGALIFGTATLSATALLSVKNPPDQNFDYSKYLAKPITDVQHLTKNKDDMKIKMELFIMKIQADFVRSLEGRKDEVKFDEIS